MKLLKYIFKIIKKFKERKKVNYEIGDIIWAKRYDNNIEMENIPKGHREGPYIIIGSTGRKYNCLSCSSQNNNPIMQYKINKYKYGLNRDTYAYIANIHILSKKRIIKKLDKLDNEDLNDLYKQLFVANNKYSLKMDINNIDFKFDYNIGDIILYYNQMVYIYDKDNAYLYGYITHRAKENQKGVYINDSKYFFLVNTVRKIPGDSNIKLIDKSRLEDVKAIQKYIEKEKVIIQNNSILNRGKLIKYNGNIYYIYGEHKEDLLLYKIYTKDQEISDKIKIKINDNSYYTLFEEEKMSKYKKARIIKIAIEDEMTQISKQKKSFIMTNKENNKKVTIKCKNYKEGKIIADNNTLERYVIIKRVGNKIVYVSLYDNKYYVHDFSDSLDFNFSVIEDMDKYKFQTIKHKTFIKK